MKLKKRNGFTLLELTAVLIVVGILLAIGLYYYGSIQKDAKVSAAEQELQTIAAAAASYAMLSQNPVASSTGAELLVPLAETEAVDGKAHERFLANGRWNKNGDDTSLKDPWGSSYTITYGDTRTVECTPTDTSIKKMVQSF